jgi:hypothetical protein
VRTFSQGRGESVVISGDISVTALDIGHPVGPCSRGIICAANWNREWPSANIGKLPLSGYPSGAQMGNMG